MYKYHCLNPISPVGLEKFSDDYEPDSEMRRSRCGPGKKCRNA